MFGLTAGQIGLILTALGIVAVLYCYPKVLAIHLEKGTGYSQLLDKHYRYYVGTRVGVAISIIGLLLILFEVWLSLWQ